ncbi:MAG: HAMP domain-containing protein [Sphingomonadaceae bacterium]|jgi:two-component system nitrogen regulation sensor histidine kinase NtrY|nr:HAMP domain-containing protein [Sphingomonadaceae bacterium]
MEGATATLPRKSPRWWRQFVVASRRANIFRYLEIAAVLAVAAMIYATWYSFTHAPAGGQLLPSAQVATLLIGTLIPSLALIVLFGRRMALRRAAGSTARLHVRLVFFFSMVAAVPTLLVAGFAAFLFQSGVDFWFSDNSRGLMRNADELAREYYVDNQVQVSDESVAMAGDLRYYFQNSQQTAFTDRDFVDFVSYQMGGRNINESAILQRAEDGSLLTVATYDITEQSEPGVFGTRVIERLRSGERAVVEANDARIEALVAIDKNAGIYLYNVRNLEERGFESWQRAKAISSAYEVLISRARALQLRFNLALYFVALALVGIAVWFALRFADRQVEPLTDLVVAAGKVGAGNFALRVEGRTGSDEIGLLNRAFNRMTAQIEKQTDALVGANAQLDQRRAFVEALLESITAGIISLDGEGRIQLINSSAQELLLAGDIAPGSARNMEQVAPQIDSLLKAGLSSGIVTHNREGELLTLAVKITETGDGRVITFEDITRQLLDQRQAAWSDVARRIAHEIKNPLTPIQLATERLKRRYRKLIEVDGELFDDLTDTIVRQVGDLRKMVDEFSSFARLPKPVFRLEDSLDLVRQAMFLQEVAHPQVDFRLDTEIEGDAIINCDRHQVGQAMTNVLKNAVEAVEAKAAASEPDYRGRIAVSVAANEKAVCIVVEDNGVGLPQDRERIAEPYVTTREKGTGLGLAIVNKIVEEHGGEMTFANAPDGGTRVTLRLARQPGTPAMETRK